MLISSINSLYTPEQTVLKTEPPAAIQKEMKANLANHTLAVYRNGKIKYYNQRNLKPVFLAIEANDIKDAFIFDRRVSKASAVLFAYGGAKFVKTPLMSKSAKEFFDKKGIKYDADVIADSVIDRNSKLKCPLEKLVLDTDDPKTAYEILKQRVFPRGIDYEKQYYNDRMTPEDYKSLDNRLKLLYMNKQQPAGTPSFKGAFYNATAFIQNHTLLNRGLTNVGGCAIPHAIMSNTKEEAMERLGMSAMSVTFAFIMPLFLLPGYNKFFLSKNNIVKNFTNNEKKIIQLSKEFLTKEKTDFVKAVKNAGIQLKAEKDFENILKRFEGREEELRKKLIKTHEQILRSDFMSTGLLMGSIPWIATSVTEHITGRKGFSATFNMLEEKEISKKEQIKDKIKRISGTLAFALIPGFIISKAVTSGLCAKGPNIIKNNASNFDYTSGVSMSKTVNAMKWAFTGFLAKLPSSRDRYELRDRTAREGATFVMFFCGDFLINNILGRLLDKYLGTKIMRSDKRTGFWKSFSLPIRRFTKIDMMKNVSPEVIKKTKNIGAGLYWVSLLSNMAVLGFTLPHFLNRMLLHTVEKDKAKTHQRPAFRSFPVFNSVEEWTNRLSS